LSTYVVVCCLCVNIILIILYYDIICISIQHSTRCVHDTGVAKWPIYNAIWPLFYDWYELKYIHHKTTTHYWLLYRILDHPNVKLFISHGGLMGILDALYSGVPIVGIPMFADQFSNMNFIVQNDCGLQMQLDQIDEEIANHTISSILHDDKWVPIYVIFWPNLE